MPSQQPELQLRVLEALESARNYNRWIASLAQRHLGDDPVEVGSGLGVYAELWIEGGAPRLTVSELDPAALGELRRRFAGDERITVEPIDLTDAPDRDHSAVVALNVLEHVADDAAGLRGATRLVRPGGAVVIFVPAFPFALGRFDRLIGHHRRYTLATIRETFARAGVELVEARYVNAMGLPGWFVAVRLLRLVPREGRVLAAWDRLVMPVQSRVERRWAPPFGQSIFAVGRAPG